MRFNTIIGNPPYNNGIDLDFAYNMYDALDNVNGQLVFIAPAKWKTASREQRVDSLSCNYGTFRDKLLIHMNTIIFYPVCTDVFDIMQIDGISIYSILKNKDIIMKKITNKCNRIDEYNNECTRELKEYDSLLNIGQVIIDMIDSVDMKTNNGAKFMFPVITGACKYQVWVNTKPPGGAYTTLNASTSLSQYFLGNCYIDLAIKSNEPNRHSGARKCVFESNSKECCLNFIKWLNNKLNRFTLCAYMSRLTNNLNDHCFRHAYSPIDWTFEHVLSDHEVYKKYNLFLENNEKAEVNIGDKKYILIDVIDKLVKDREFDTNNDMTVGEE